MTAPLDRATAALLDPAHITDEDAARAVLSAALDDIDEIARVLLMVTQGEGVSPEYAWSVQDPEVQEELLAQAEAVRAYLLGGEGR
ncbi:hypothetical protein DNL40_02555 [Xylanimonas oleitrophica]|uniref:Uncharacterized protein n=1 Tax=Xylanimonas oleitrophica TaxID=2607479 RepID=A0A2W5YJB2_9MICO|nr:hypothetical protein [Xylanimonas oleitrophica]PZR55271.1 hypothetical protein DNL40_02555 [Xylanimonas oleitrophica]